MCFKMIACQWQGITTRAELHWHVPSYRTSLFQTALRLHLFISWTPFYNPSWKRVKRKGCVCEREREYARDRWNASRCTFDFFLFLSFFVGSSYTGTIEHTITLAVHNGWGVSLYCKSHAIRHQEKVTVLESGLLPWFVLRLVLQKFLKAAIGSNGNQLVFRKDWYSVTGDSNSGRAYCRTLI